MMKFLTYPAAVLSLTLGLMGCNAQSTTSAADSLKANTTLPGSDQARNRTPHLVDGMDLDPTNSAVSKLIYKRLTWDTGGGGDLHYSIAPDDEAGKSYTLNLSARSFRTFDENYSIHPDTGALYKKIHALFRGKIQVSSPPETPGSLTGTWSSLKLYDLVNVVTEYKSPTIADTRATKLFEDIRNFIEEEISTNVDNCSTLPDLAGAWKSSSIQPNLTRSTVSTLNKVESTDGSLKYEGTDEITSRDAGGDSTQTTQVLHYTYRYLQDQCTLTQTGEHGEMSFKIVYIANMPGFTKLKLLACTDNTCATSREGVKEVSITRSAP